MIIKLDITPVPAPRMVNSDRWAKRECVQKYFAYRDWVIWYCKKEGYVLQPELYIEFWMPMPDSWSKKKKNQMLYHPHTQKPDLDNLIKGFMDAFGKDDSFVYKITAEKSWSVKGQIILMV